MLAEATRELGGRINRECRLPGLSEWARVRDYRVQQIEKMDNVEIFRESKLTAEDVLAVNADHVAVATGARWRKDLFNGARYEPIPIAHDARPLLTPDDIMDGTLPQGQTVIFDDDHYYMGSVLAERLRLEGREVILVTTGEKASAWSQNTGERSRVQSRLLELNVEIIVAHELVELQRDQVVLSCSYTGKKRAVAADSLLLVGQRSPDDRLYGELRACMESGAVGAPSNLKRIGDCHAPAIIAAAVYSGHRYAQEFDQELDQELEMPGSRNHAPRYDRVLFE